MKKVNPINRIQKAKLLKTICSLIILIIFSSCGGDDDGPQQPTEPTVMEKLIAGDGKWYLESEQNSTAYNECGKQSYVQFFENGNFKVETFSEKNNDCESLDIVTGFFNIINNNTQLHLDYGNGKSLLVNIISLTKDRFVFKDTDSGVIVTYDKTKGNFVPNSFTNNVYITGLAQSPNAKYVAMLWENGASLPPLTDGTKHAIAYSVFVSGGDMYIGGSSQYKDNVLDDVATLWKNGVPQYYSDGSKPAGVISVFVSGNDVYAAGYDNSVATLWKNGVATSLTNGTNNSGAYGVFVSGTDVYAVGFQKNGSKYVAKVWKNNTEQVLTDGSENAIANSVFVLGNDVYVAGFNGKVATLWKNGVAEPLSDGTSAAGVNSVFVTSTDVYAVGYDTVNAVKVAMLWKNGVGQFLTNGANDATAESVYVSGNDVYVAGKENNGTKNIAVFWKNGTLHPLTDGATQAGATSVFVDDGQL